MEKSSDEQKEAHVVAFHILWCCSLISKSYSSHYCQNFFSSFKPHVESEELLGQNVLNQICGQSAAAEKKGMASKRSH